MRASRKGTKLNDVQYFKQPLPHTRQRMTAILLMPRVSNLRANRLLVGENFRMKSKRGSRGRSKQVELKRESIEMALLTCNREPSKEDLVEGLHHEISAETETDLLERPSENAENDEEEETIEEEDEEEDKVEKTVTVTSVVESLVEKPRKEQKVEANIEKRVEKRNGCTNTVNRTIVVQQEVRHKKNAERTEEDENAKRQSGWWRHSWIRQMISNVYAHFIGGKSNNTKGRRKTVNEEIFINTRNGRRRGETCRAGSKDNEEHENVVSVLRVKQIERTRDKNLRVTLLQQELQARLRCEATYSGEALEEELATRQLSSPLC